MRVMGSHAISTSSDWAGSVVVTSVSPGFLVAGQQLGALLAPLGLLVGGFERELAQGADHRAVHATGSGGDLRPGRLVHERHELVWEAGHRAGDADATHGGT